MHLRGPELLALISGCQTGAGVVRESPAHGHVGVQNNLGGLYELGHGVTSGCS
jgi:hypothetical protein